MMKKVRKLLALVLSLALVLGGVSLAGIKPVSAKDSSPFTFSGTFTGTEVVLPFESFASFLEDGVAGGQASTVSLVGGKGAFGVTANIDCILYVVCSKTHSFNDTRVYNDSACSIKAKGEFNFSNGYGLGECPDNATGYVFMKKGSSVFFNSDYNEGGSFTLGYTSLESNYPFTLTAKKTSDGVSLTAKSKNKTDKVHLCAGDEGISFKSYVDKGGALFTIRAQNDLKEKGEKTITLPSTGAYTVKVMLYDASETYPTIFLLQLDTKDYLKGSGSKTSKLEAPLVALAKTNVIVGYATPNAKVTVKQGKKTYTATADDTGLYAVITGKLKKGSTIKIWEGTDSTGKAALSVKIK